MKGCHRSHCLLVSGVSSGCAIRASRQARSWGGAEGWAQKLLKKGCPLGSLGSAVP